LKKITNRKIYIYIYIYIYVLDVFASFLVFFKDFLKKNLLSTRLVVNAIFFVNVDIASFFKKKSKYNKWEKRPKLKWKEMRDQKKFRLLGDQAIRGKKI